MSKKEMSEEFKADKVTVEEEFRFGISSSLTVNMIKGKSIYKFEMPMGSQLTECEEACNKCLEIVKKMKAEGEQKKAEAEKKAEDEKPKEEAEATKEEAQEK